MKKTLTKVLLSLFLTALLLTAFAGGSALLIDVEAANDEAKWGNSDSYNVGIGSITDAFNYANTLASGTAYIQLQNDVSTSSALVVNSGKTVELDLNGKKINRGLASVTGNGNVLTVNGNLTVLDKIGGGMITGGYNSSYGGGVYVAGSFTLKSGSISGNKSSTDGGGIYSVSGSSVKIEGGTISLNQGARGGGIYAGGSLTISGSAIITENNATSNGGGVFYNASLTVSGKPEIKNNVSGGSLNGATITGGINNNLYVADKIITIASTGLESGAEIWITTSEAPAIGSTITSFANTDYSAYFLSDNYKYVVKNTGNGSTQQLVMDWQEAIWGLNAQYSAGGGTIDKALTYVSSQGSAEVFIKLQKDVTLTAGIVIPARTNVQIDLCGKTINRNLTSAMSGGYVISVAGSLIINDSNSGGKITGGHNTGNGGGINVAAGGALTINNGVSIAGNKAAQGGGVYLESNAARLTLNSGTISNNTATGSGGGIYIGASGTAATITSSVSITGNNAQNGAGIYLADGATLNFSGRVTGNTSTGEGGGIYVAGTFNASGTAYVYSNNKGTVKNNVYLLTGKVVNVNNSTPLTGDARMGITTANDPTSGSPIEITSIVSSNISGFFVSDKSSYGLQNFVSGSSHVLKLCNSAIYIEDLAGGKITRRTYTSGLTYKVTTTNISNGTAATITWYNNLSKSLSGSGYAPTGLSISPVGTVNNNTLTLNVSTGSSSNAGDYYFTVTINGMESDVKILKVNRTALAIPTVSGTYSYTGSQQTVTLSGYDSGTMEIVSGNRQTNVYHDYIVIIKLRDTTQYEWSTGNDTNVSVHWSINKAKLTRPTVTAASTYKGALQTAQLTGFNATLMNISGNEAREVNKYSLSISLKDTANYEWDNNYGTAPLTLEWEIKKAPLTIKANDVNITYGEAYTAFSVSYNGLVGTDTSAVLTGTLRLTCSYIQYNNAGTYLIIPSGLTSANYEISHANGTLTVNKKKVTVNWSNTQFTYDGNPHLPTASLRDYPGTGTVSVSGSRSGAGSYTAEAIGFIDVNYELANPTVSFTISKLPLTITAKNITAVYGQTPDGDGVTYSGFIASENSSVLTGTLTYTFDYEQYDDVGSDYKVTPGGLSSSNYDITYVSGRLTVTKAALVIKINDITSLDGSLELTYTVTEGTLFSPDKEYLIIMRSAGDTPGRYSIAGTLASENYQASITPGTYTILQSSLSASGDSKGILVSAKGGINPDYKFLVKQIGVGDVKKHVAKGKVLSAYEISLVDNLATVQPDGSIAVKIPVGEYDKYEELKVVSIDKSGRVQNITTERSGEYLSVTVDSLSTLAVVTLDQSYTWIWITAVIAVVVIGGGVCVYLFAFKKKD